jgi:hypothetical protein
MRVSLVMMVKAEEANLPDCLACAAILFPWCDRFGAARNQGLRHATGDFAYWLDAADPLDEDNRGEESNLWIDRGGGMLSGRRGLSPATGLPTAGRAR